MDEAGMTVVRDAFANAARRAHRAGFDVVELHAAHGYLMHEFCSPLANKRTDRYGGSLDNRLRFPLEVAAAMREAWPRERPLGARITGSDWIDGGFTPDEAGVFATRLRETGFDYVDVSSGAIAPGIPIPGGELAYQLPFAETVKAASGLPTMTVGMIVDPHQAEAIVASGKADMVSLARAFLDDPNWAHHARAALGDPPAPPVQYARAWPEAWPGWKIAHPATP
jgi:2,4-dienoyl-CoA reductase-like NADH-dependent reductase (Old Yellow Enzyme family)